MKKEAIFKFTIEAIKKKFPQFNIKNILKYHIWRADYAQPITTINYKNIIPKFNTPIKNVYISTMAQIYPEDRGTNQAVKHGIENAKKIINNI
jgi:protoporphyrinogen oxidase